MEVEIKIPSVGESVKEAVLVQWYKKDGDPVQKDEPIFEPDHRPFYTTAQGPLP